MLSVNLTNLDCASVCQPLLQVLGVHQKLPVLLDSTVLLSMGSGVGERRQISEETTYNTVLGCDKCSGVK